MNKEALKEFMVTVAKADRQAPVAFSYGDKEYSYEQLNDALRAELKTIAGDYSLYRQNKNMLFELIEEVVDLVLPKNVMANLMQFAEVKTFSHGDKAYFKRRQSALRGRQFVTRAAIGGVYEAFKLSSEVITVETQAYGGAAQIGLEEFLEGSVDFAELIQIINTGLEIAVYKEVVASLVALATGGIANYAGGLTNALPANNIVSAAGWAPLQFINLLNIARAYGEPTIFCSEQFAISIKPNNHFVSDADRAEIRANGYVGRFHGARVVVLPQSFFNVTNNANQVVVPAGYAWIIPGGTDKPVKVAFEGQTVVEEFSNRDWSKEIQVFKKFGVTVITNPGICVYEDTALAAWPAVSGPVLSLADGAVTPVYTRALA